jgi:ElaB/YqjD/DUF883 family membrane-anchored ribosome-binding protein
MINRLQGCDLGSPAEQVKHKAQEYASFARDTLASGAERFKRFVAEQPATALGAGIGLGVFLGWLIKRR